jgi:hypothetical protein
MATNLQVELGCAQRQRVGASALARQAVPEATVRRWGDCRRAGAGAGAKHGQPGWPQLRASAFAIGFLGATTLPRATGAGATHLSAIRQCQSARAKHLPSKLQASYTRSQARARS